MNFQVTRLNNKAKLPEQFGPIWKLYAASKVVDTNGNIVYGTGLSIHIPDGYVGLVVPRQDNYITQLLSTQAVIQVDPKNEEEVKIRFKHVGSYYTTYKGNNKPEWEVGDCIGSLMIVPDERVYAEMEEV